MKESFKELFRVISIGGKVYEVINILVVGGESITGENLLKMAKEMNAHLGQDHGEHILEHASDIPEDLKGRATFVFTDWLTPENAQYNYCIGWNGHNWVKYWTWLYDEEWGRGYLLRLVDSSV